MQTSKKVFDFKKQLSFGERGEKDFLKYYKGSTKHETRDYDFDWNGKKIELKTDSYNFSMTDNFFIERYSDYTNLKDGSVWQSIDCDYFVYYYINEGIFYWFDIKKFKNFLDEYIKDKSYILIRNKGWTALGYKVNREDCKDYIIRKDKF